MQKSLVIAALCYMALTLGTLAHQTNYVVINDNSNSRIASDSRYDYIYMNPPRPQLEAYGHYVRSTGGVRYVHSPSKHKRAAHAARIDAYNYQMYH